MFFNPSSPNKNMKHFDMFFSENIKTISYMVVSNERVLGNDHSTERRAKMIFFYKNEFSDAQLSERKILNKQVTNIFFALRSKEIFRLN